MNFLRSITIWAWVLLGDFLVAATTPKNTVIEVSTVAGAVTISDGRGGFKTYQVRPSTEILLNNQKVKLEDVVPGMVASITGGDAGMASRIILSATASSFPNAKAAPRTSKLKVAATAIKANPTVVGKVLAGDTVTITPIKTWWSGGGSKTGEFCDWEGYPKTNKDGKPWMALVAAIGETLFVPTGGTLSFAVPSNGTLILYPNHDQPNKSQGFAEVTVAVNQK